MYTGFQYSGVSNQDEPARHCDIAREGNKGWGPEAKSQAGVQGAKPLEFAEALGFCTFFQAWKT